MIWIYKAIIQKTISILPFSYRINYLLQRYVSHGKELPISFVIERINHARNHIDSFNKWSDIPFEKVSVLEIGTGWYPIVPVVCFLSGAHEIETTDIKKLYNKQSVNQTIRAFITLYNSNSLFELIPNLQIHRIESLELALEEKCISRKLSLLNIKTTLYNGDGLISNSKDLIISNNTFQFIKKDNLYRLLNDISRVGTSNSVISIAIDLTDEFSHFDKTISNYNFLKFSNTEWQIISNRLNSPSRLRYSDYKKLFSSKFEIVHENILRGRSAELDEIKIHKLFAQYDLSDLLIKHAHIVCLNKKGID